MRKAEIYYHEVLAGILTENEEGHFIYQYDEEYVKNYPDQFLTFTMRVTAKPFHDKRLFSFFEGLIPEGWLLDIAVKNWKVKPNDSMGLLLACCQNCIGAISVKPLTGDHE